MSHRKIINLLAVIIVLQTIPFLFVHAQDLKNSMSDYRKVKKNLTVTPVTTTDPASTPTQSSLDPKKQQLTKLVSILIEIQNNQKDQISTLTGINQLQKDQLTQVLQTSTGNLMSKATKIDSAENAEKLKALATDILDSWNSGQLQFKKNLYEMLISQIEDATARFDFQIKDLQKSYDTLKNKNKDVSLLQTKITDAETKLASIKTISSEITQKINSFNKGSDLTGGFQDVLNSASQTTSAFQVLRQSIFDATTEISRLNK